MVTDIVKADCEDNGFESTAWLSHVCVEEGQRLQWNSG